MITDERINEVCSSMTAAGAGWAVIARRLPEFLKLSHGIPAGPGMHRPWVLLDGEYEGVPARLLRHENGVWAVKGTYAREIERRGHGEAPVDPAS